MEILLPEPITLLDRVHNLGKPRTAEEARADLQVYLEAKRTEFNAKLIEEHSFRFEGVDTTVWPRTPGGSGILF